MLNVIFNNKTERWVVNIVIYTAIVLFEQSKCVDSIFTSDKR